MIGLRSGVWNEASSELRYDPLSSIDLRAGVGFGAFRAGAFRAGAFRAGASYATDLDMVQLPDDSKDPKARQFYFKTTFTPYKTIKQTRRNWSRASCSLKRTVLLTTSDWEAGQSVSQTSGYSSPSVRRLTVRRPRH